MSNEFDFNQAVEDALDSVRDQFAEVRQQVHAACQSPIETRMADALMTCGILLEGRPPECIGPTELPNFDQSFRPALIIAPQRPIGAYRADFALWFCSILVPVRMVVECDGHDFHEKTKEQARRDKARDRYMLARGWPVMRFTGSEIHQDPEKCADEVGSHMFDLWVKANGGPAFDE